MAYGTTTNVSAGKPSTGGSIFRAVAGSTLPQNATATLDAAFKHLGYVSEDGLKNNNTPSVDKLKAWGGDNVLTTQTEKTDTFSFKLIEALNEEVLKAVYGAGNVSGTFAAGLTVTANSTEQVAAAWVCDMVMTGGYVKRIVIPNGKISEIGEIAYTDSDAVGYELTVEALPDASGNTHYEYIKAPSTTTVGGGN